MLWSKPAEQQKTSRPLAIVGKGWSWLFLCVLFVFFSLTGRGFFTFFNLQNILTDMAFLLLVALGETFVIVAGGIDLSTGYTMGLSSMVAALTIMALGPILPFFLAVTLALVAGIVVGTLPGILNGLIITRLSVPPFIVTLGMYGIVRGTSFLLGQGLPVYVTINGVGDLGNGYLFYLLPTGGLSFFRIPAGLSTAQLHSVVGVLPFQLLVCILLVFVCYWLLTHTSFGVHTYAIGGNSEAALKAGIPVKYRLVQIYALAATLASIAGGLYMLRFTSGETNAGDATLLDSIAAVAIGGASLLGGKGTIIGTLIGALIIAVIQNGLVILGIDPLWQFIAIGVVIIVAVFVDQTKARVIGE